MMNSSPAIEDPDELLSICELDKDDQDVPRLVPSQLLSKEHWQYIIITFSFVFSFYFPFVSSLSDGSTVQFSQNRKKRNLGPTESDRF